MGVFGQRGRVTGWSTQPADDGVRPTLHLTWPPCPLADSQAGLPDHEGFSGENGQDDALDTRTTTIVLDALHGIGGLEHERSRHRGERQVERDIDEDGREYRPTIRHGSDSTRFR